MTEPAGRGRSVLRLPRVEFDLAALVLGAIGVVALTFLWPLVASLVGAESGGLRLPQGAASVEAPPVVVLRESFFRRIEQSVPVPGVSQLVGLVRGPQVLLARQGEKGLEIAQPPELEGWKFAVVASVLLVAWAVLGGAIARVYALRKARDRTIRFDDALAFSCGSAPQAIGAVLFAVTAAVLFGGLTVACGALSGIPWAGPVLQVAAQPAAFLLTICTAILAIGLVVGLPILLASVAVERNGSLDAVSRTWSYVWTRPVPFAAGTAIVLVVASLIENVAAVVQGAFVQFFSFGASLADQDLGLRIRDAARAALSFGSAPVADLGGSAAASVWIAWALFAVLFVLVRGFVVSYVIGGFVDVYFMLREEADGVDGSEVFVEGAGEALSEPGTPPKEG